MKWLVILLLICTPALADERSDLIGDLNEYVDDADNEKMTAAQKIRFLDKAGKELGEARVYHKLDTVVTVSGQENYSLNSDAAKALRGVYVKLDRKREYIQVVEVKDLPLLAEPEGQKIAYAFVSLEGQLGLRAIPTAAETLIVSYYAYPAALATDSTEWDIPDAFEDAGLRIAAAKILHKVETVWAERKRQQLYEQGWADVQRLGGTPPPQTTPTEEP
jgi:hypothetical protein